MKFFSRRKKQRVTQPARQGNMTEQFTQRHIADEPTQPTEQPTQRPTLHNRQYIPNADEQTTIQKSVVLVRDAFLKYTGRIDACCGPASVILAEHLMRQSIACEQVWNGYHAWVQVGEYAADPTASQFDSDTELEFEHAPQTYQMPSDNDMRLRTIVFYEDTTQTVRDLASYYKYSRYLFPKKADDAVAMCSPFIVKQAAHQVVYETDKYAESEYIWNHAEKQTAPYPLI